MKIHKDPEATIAVAGSNIGLFCRISRQSKHLDAPEVISIRVDKMADFLDARGIKLDHPQTCIIVGQVSEISLNINSDLVDSQVPKASGKVRIEAFCDCKRCAEDATSDKPCDWLQREVSGRI